MTACLSLLVCLPLLGGAVRPAQAANTAARSIPLLGFFDADQGGADNGPVRMARFAYLNGDVTWRPDSQSDWSPAANNMPLRQGAQIWVPDSGRAEIQFDDGSRVRLDSNSLITLQTLYSDAQGEFTEITLNDGRAFLRLTNRYSVYQVNTPEASIKASGPARLRVGAGEGGQFAVRRGSATIEGANGTVTLHQGDYLDITDSNAPYQVSPLPSPDDWDTWNEARDRRLDGYAHRPHYMPSNIALVGDDLDDYGNWHHDGHYGWVWAPHVTDADWRPYGSGNWTWVEPYGWTWVADDPWGWAPYHYGTWVHASYGWGWCPGPATQYWSPAVVSFSYTSDRVAWCALAPTEVRYPSALSVGFRSASWSLFFSIGSAAVYYPTANHYCVARPWANAYVNRFNYNNHVTNVTNITNITVNHNTYLTNNFVPANARYQGGTQVEARNFGGRGAYQRVTKTQLAVFSRGRTVAAPAGGRPLAGPQGVRITPQAFTPTRSFSAASRVPQAVVARSVYRAAPPANVPRAYTAPQSGQRFVSRAAAFNTPGMHLSAAPRRVNTRPIGAVHGGSTPTRAIGTRPGSPHNAAIPNRPVGTRPGGSTPTRSVTPPSHTGHSSGLDAYLRDRAAAQGHNGNNANANRYQPTRRHTVATPNANRPAPEHNVSTPNVNRSNANANRYRPAPVRTGSNPGNFGNDAPRNIRSVTPPHNANPARPPSPHRSATPSSTPQRNTGGSFSAPARSNPQPHRSAPPAPARSNPRPQRSAPPAPRAAPPAPPRNNGGRQAARPAAGNRPAPAPNESRDRNGGHNRP